MSPGEGDLARAELAEAEESLRAARLLLDAGSIRSAASRLYYAGFHAARAALTIRGLHSKTHSGQIRAFARTFGSVGVLSRLLELRQEADYEAASFGEGVDTLRAVAEQTAGFVDRCRQIVEEAVSRGPDEPDPPEDY